MGSREKMAQYDAKRTSIDAARTENDTCRRRIGQLLDVESFVELDSLVTARELSFGPERPKVTGDGVVTGYGTIDGRLVFLAAQDPDVYGGSIGQMHAKKMAKALRLAIRAQVPFIGLYDTGGVRVEEGLPGLEGLGEFLAVLDEASGLIPLISGVMGPCAGGAAFAVANSDFVLMSEKSPGVFMNGPMVISAVENKSLGPAEIGGASVHAEKTGLATLTAANEEELIAQIKQLMPYIPDSCAGFHQRLTVDDDPNRTETRLDTLAAAMDEGYDMREAIDLIVDTGSFMELSPAYASNLIAGLARLDGITVGVLAVAGARVNGGMARKAASMAALFDRLNLPLITFVDTEGYEISSEEERKGLVSAGAALMQTMLRLSIPRIGVLTGKAIGSAYLTFGSKVCGMNFVYAWPTAEIAVVNPDTAAEILYRKDIAASEDPIKARKDFVKQYAEEIAGPYVAASLGHVDEVILPSATRPHLISALDMLTAVY